ncbi:unnamed protein product [Nesidiocoris tenuis]|uniref:Peptidase M48 domain-containing protein n=1 Tax=Nesidiocoris tenuis TaxID=355587 RepID=A0A6H5GQL8_9HEMI|nr:unnamed protein product [Nesidiocoris tenuis]
MIALSFQPLGDDDVGLSVKAVAERVGFPPDKIYIDRDSEASAGAYFSGFPGVNMIVITTKLKDLLSPIQLTSAVAHELGHWKRRHNRIEYLAMILRTGLFFAMCRKTYGNEGVLRIFGFTETPHPMIPVYLSIYFFWPIVQDLFNGIHAIIQRSNEFSADDFACDLGLAGELRDSLLLMAARTFSFPLFDTWCSAWYLGHPTILERVRRISSRRR